MNIEGFNKEHFNKKETSKKNIFLKYIEENFPNFKDKLIIIDEINKKKKIIYLNSENYRKAFEFFKKLELEENVNPKKYLTYHLVTASTPPTKIVQEFDLEGDKSILRFVRKFYTERIQENFPKWEERIKEINEKKEKLYSNEKKLEVNHNKISQFIEYLEKKYDKSELSKCLAYYLLTDDIPQKKDIEFFDFSGEDSIENFLDKLLEEQEREEKKNLNTKTEDFNKG